MSDSKPTIPPLNPPERERVYTFPDGRTLTLKSVTHFLVRPSGSHRLMTADGFKWIVHPLEGWSIRLDVDEWTV